MSAAPKIQSLPVPASPPASAETPRAILHPKLDFWMIGGASILAFIGYQLFSGDTQESYNLSYFTYALSFVVNWPHFAVSYQILYQDRGDRIFRKPTFFWAAVAVPLILLGVFTAAFFRRDDVLFSALVQFMYVTVGWHYIKQTFGLMVVTGVREKFYFNRLERGFLLANLGSLWLLSFISGEVQERESNFLGIKYDLIGLPERYLYLAYGFFAVTAACVLVAFVRRYIRDGSKPPVLTVTAFTALYVWYLPFASHRLFFYVIPLFHSLQYLLCVFGLKRGEWRQAFGNLEGPEARRKWLAKPAIYFGTSLALGIAFFLMVPGYLDNKMPDWNPDARWLWSATIFTASFQVFINIHHYFIDNVIWTKDNPEIGKYLLK